MKIKSVSIYKLINDKKFIYVINIKVTKKMIIMNLNFQISEIYHNLTETFNSLKADKLVSHHKNNLEINLKSDIKSFFKSVYKFSENEHESFHKYLNSSLVSE